MPYTGDNKNHYIKIENNDVRRQMSVRGVYGKDIQV